MIVGDRLDAHSHGDPPQGGLAHSTLLHDRARRKNDRYGAVTGIPVRRDFKKGR
jgi:hypothetical protein